MRWHVEWYAGDAGCLPEHIDSYRTKSDAIAAYAGQLADGEDGMSMALICPCDEPRCDWCREAGADVMPRVYAALSGDEVIAFPICDSCVANTASLREILSDWSGPDDPTPELREIEVAGHQRSETCIHCEALVLLDPIGVDSSTGVTYGNRFDFVEV